VNHAHPAALIAISFAGHVWADVVQISADTYMVVRSSKAGIFASMSKLKVAAIQEANAYAARLGKVVVPISTQERPAGGPGQWPTVEYQFRLVSKDDPSANVAALLPRPDVVVESNSHTVTEIKADERSPDLYNELMKLDDLRKRGLLTDAEFEDQKKRLLEKAK
jgi:hypothetical protein